MKKVNPRKQRGISGPIVTILDKCHRKTKRMSAKIAAGKGFTAYPNDTCLLVGSPSGIFDELTRKFMLVPKNTDKGPSVTCEQRERRRGEKNIIIASTLPCSRVQQWLSQVGTNNSRVASSATYREIFCVGCYIEHLPKEDNRRTNNMQMPGGSIV